MAVKNLACKLRSRFCRKAGGYGVFQKKEGEPETEKLPDETLCVRVAFRRLQRQFTTIKKLSRKGKITLIFRSLGLRRFSQLSR